MSGIDNRIVGCNFGYYTEEEILKLSVKEIYNPLAFDSLFRPLPNGLYDPALGVSPYDRLSKCETCGFDNNNCVGHCGHIQLAAPIYNPFLFLTLFKLLRGMCMNCHMMRLSTSKIDYFILKMKLLKLGYLVEASNLKNIYAGLNSIAHTNPRELKELSTEGLHFVEDEEEMIQDNIQIIEEIQEEMDKNTNPSSPTPKPKVKKDQKETNVDFQKRKLFLAELQSSKETQIRKYKELISQNADPSKLQSSSACTKAINEVLNEFWKNIISRKCPHCKYINGRIKREGYRKFFQMPLSGRDKRSLKVIGLKTTSLNYEELNEVESDGETTISSLDEENEEEMKDEDEQPKKMEKLSGKQVLLHPIEVKEHISQLWKKMPELLGLFFGSLSYEPTQLKGKDSFPYKINSNCFNIFFVQTLLVPPNRFRPESKGTSDQSYLHQHTVMLTRILNNSLALKDLLLPPPSKKIEDSTEKREEKKTLEEKNKKGRSKKEIDDIRSLVEKEIQEKGLGIGEGLSMAEGKKKRGNLSQIMTKWLELQESVNVYFDSSKASKVSEKDLTGLRQILERKEGMFRMKMMGKRVNYAIRSVISPDPYINTNEIAIPQFMAKKLSFPEDVGFSNLNRLRKLVVNGPHIYPGANMIEDEKKNRIYLSALNKEEREELSNHIHNCKVYRHMTNGDILLVNRQPTLHKLSIMAHKAKVLSNQQTLRFHYANCSSYNADFDGDEINAHYIQNYLAVAEGNNIMLTDYQYIVPTSGQPLRGLIQDSIVSGVFLTKLDTFFSKSMYQQLVYAALQDLLNTKEIPKIKILRPSILKPRPLYTGKQVITTILKSVAKGKYKDYDPESLKGKKFGLNLDSQTKLQRNAWGPFGENESNIVIRNNELLSGILDKSQLGASTFGIIHSFHEIYGATAASNLLSCFGKILTQFLQIFGFSVGVEDLLLTSESEFERKQRIEFAHIKAIKAAASFSGMNDYSIPDYTYSNRYKYERGSHKVKFTDRAKKTDIVQQALYPLSQNIKRKLLIENKEKEFDIAIKNSLNQSTSKIIQNAFPDGLYKKFPSNLMSVMVLAGAKGSLVNHSQISILLGQQELEGKRVPLTPSGRTLPSFLPYDPNPRAYGYISDRFLTGIRPQEFFYHCMAGREGLIDTAVKTSRVGYLQRCLIKQLESLVVNYDLTVRDADNSIIQFYAGEDSIDPKKTKFLNQFKFIVDNYQPLLDKYNISEVVNKLDTKSVTHYRKTLNQQIKAGEKINQTTDTVLSKYVPSRYFGSISEKLHNDVLKYIRTNPNKKILTKKERKQKQKSKYKLHPNELKKLTYLQYFYSLIHPGENVGTIAGQSIGEPSTQMTLNTFHLAGHGGTNVTVGIPRLREILMTNSINIKTPIMTIPFLDQNIEKKDAQAIINLFKKVCFADIVKTLEINENVEKSENSNFRFRKYTLTIQLEIQKAIRKAFTFSFEYIAKVFKTQQIYGLNDKRAHEVIEIITAKDAPTTQGDPLDEEEEEELPIKLLETSVKEIEDIDGFDVQKRKFKKSTYEDEGFEREKSEVLSQTHSNIDVPQSQEVKKTNKKEKQTMNVQLTENKMYQYFKSAKQDKKKNQFELVLMFPLEYRKVLMQEVVKTTLSEVLLRAIPKINNSFYLERKIQGAYEKVLQTDGINIFHCYQFDKVLDLQKVQTNDIYSTLNNYGVEACRQNIVKEISNVFGVYGIQVDYRHLSLIADYMTFNGEIRPFNRVGIQENPSPFLKMSFETTLKYLTNSCMANEYDSGRTPSSNLVLGQLPNTGTGLFTLLQSKI